MRRDQRVWQYMKQHRIVSIVIGQLAVILVIASALLSTTFGHSVLKAFAQASCARGDQTYSVSSGDTLGSIAARYNTSSQTLVAYNHIANANTIYVGETICIPGNSGSFMQAARAGLAGTSNRFPYGQCTWWANHRYFQLHGVYVPWQTNANAWQWVARAHDYKWTVSSTPRVGAIVVLQPWVQGAYRLGHVGVVERLSNGSAIVSNMNWGAHPRQVTNSRIHPGAGVSFISI